MNEYERELGDQVKNANTVTVTSLYCFNPNKRAIIHCNFVAMFI